MGRVSREERLLRRFEWNRPLPELLISASDLCDVLLYKGSPVQDLVAAVGDNAPALALLLIDRLQQNDDLDDRAVQELRSALAVRCAHEIQQTEAVWREQNPPENWREEDAKRKNQDIPALTPVQEEALRRFGALVACACALDDPELTARVGEVLHKTITNRIQAVCLNQTAFEALSLFRGFGLPAVVRMLRLYEGVYPMHLLTSVAFDFGMKVPVQGVRHRELAEYVHGCIARGDLRYADQLLKTFLGLTVQDLGYTDETLIDHLMHTEADQQFRGLLMAEGLLEMNAGDPEDAPDDLKERSEWLQGLQRWWQLICACPAPSKRWEEHRIWFHMYYISRLCLFNAEEGLRYIRTLDAPLAYGDSGRFKKTNTVLQRAMQSLFFCGDGAIMEYLRILGDNNVFRFDPNASKTPYFEKVFLERDVSIILDQLRRQYSREEIVSIYMNTYLHCIYPLPMLVRELFGQDGSAQRTDQAEIRACFEPYPINGLLVQRSYGFGVVANADPKKEGGNINCGGAPLQISPKWLQIHGRSCKDILIPGQRIMSRVVRLADQDQFLQVEPIVEADDARQNQKLLALLKDVERQGVLTDEMNWEITGTYFGGGLTFQEREVLDVQILRCLAALSEHNDEAQTRYFINMIGQKRSEKSGLNRFQFLLRDTGKPPKISNQARVEAGKCWNRIAASGLRPEAKFFIYINTMARIVSPLSSVLTGIVDARYDLTEMMTGFTEYWFTGAVYSVDRDRKDQRLWYVTVTPDCFNLRDSAGWDRFALRTDKPEPDLKRGEPCVFLIDAYSSWNRNFFLKDVQSTASEARFCKAMEQAARNVILSEQTRADLGVCTSRMINGKNADTIGLDMLSALELHAEVPQELETFMDCLRQGSPWKLSDGKVLSGNIFTAKAGNAQAGRCIQLLQRLARHCPAELVVRVYFNSPLRSCVWLSTLVEILQQNGLEPVQIRELLSNVRLTVDSADRTPCNFYEKRAQLLDTAPQSGETSGCTPVRYADYDAQNGRIVLHLAE